MWAWLLKLISFMREEEEREGEDVSVQPVPSTNQLQAKTKNIYPRERGTLRERETISPSPVRTSQEKERHFRFPVIPDAPAEKQGQKKREKPVRVDRAPTTDRTIEKTVKRTVDRPADRSALSPSRPPAKPYQSSGNKAKQPYTPTDIISPIYGIIHPDTTMQVHTKPKRPAIVPHSPLRAEPVELIGVESHEEKEMVVDYDTVIRHDPLPEAVHVEAEQAELTKQAELIEHTEQIEQIEQTVHAEQTETWEHSLSQVENESEIGIGTPDHPEQTDPAEDHTEEKVEPCDSQPESSFFPEEELPYGSESDIKTEEQMLRAEVQHVEKEQHALIPRASVEERIAPDTGNVPQSTDEHDDETGDPVETLAESGEPIPGDSYEYPPLSLLNPPAATTKDDDEYTQIQKLLLEDTLTNFNVNAHVIGIVKGPAVTRFELQPAPGVKVNKITSLSDDIKLNLAAKDIRIEAPIPGRNAVGIEVPNQKSEPVLISRIIGSQKFRRHPSPLAVALGMDIGGEPIIADIKKMPHGLIAGATGSGKSVCINSIIVSLLYKARPDQVRLLLIDPKMVELAPYNQLPHLITPVVTDAKQATASLKWAVEEMERRYTLFAEAGARDIERYNVTTEDTLPYIVIIIDELADLMMVSPQDVEESIIRIAQKARACGIHLLLATQRPSVDVITGNIKANVPSRLAFAVFSQVDSRTILDHSGAERLLGRGDMLFLESGTAPIRLQGNYVSDDEIERVTQFIKKLRKPEYLFSKEELEQSVVSGDLGDDPLYLEALVHVAEQGQASASALQRRFRIGYNRAARLLEMMEAEGYVAGQSGGKPRTVLISREDALAVMEGSTLV